MSKLTPEAVESMSGPELVTAFNALNPEKPVKRFASRAAGVARVLAALEAAEPEEPVEKPARARAAAREARRVFRPVGGLKPPRPASKRGKLLDRLMQPEGMSREEIEDAFGWSPRDAMDALRLLAKFNGYEVTEDDEGRWRATQPSA
ncbi:MAG: hypothetical protein RIB60_01830 [Phycisphaerales bacterium]